MKLIDIKNIEVLNKGLSLLVKGGARDTRSTTTTTTTTTDATPSQFGVNLPVVKPPVKRR